MSDERERLAALLDESIEFDAQRPEDVDYLATADNLIRAGVSPSTGEGALNAAYRERNAVVAALIRTNGWPRWVSMAPDADGWVIVYAETPEGQVSWHVGPGDFDLIEDFPSTAVRPWDGHTNDEKYARIAALVSPSTGEDRLREAADDAAGYSWCEACGYAHPGNDRDCAALTPTGDTPKHRPNGAHWASCVVCDQDWPCDAATEGEQ